MAKWPARRTRNPTVPGFKSSSGHWLELFLVFPSQVVGHACKQAIGCLLPAGVFNPVMLYLNDLSLII